MDAGDYFERFSRLYRGRKRGIWMRDRFDASEDKGVFLPDEAFSLERFIEHVSGNGRSYGIHLLDSHNRVHFSMFDMDAYPRNAPAAQMTESLRALQPEVRRMCATLYRIGIERGNLLIEFSGTGFHLWMFYEEPQPAAEIKAWMQLALERAGVQGHSFKPMRTNASAQHRGDKVWLPLRVNSNQGNRSVFIADLDNFDPGNYDQRLDFSLLDRVVPLSSARLAQIRENLG